MTTQPHAHLTRPAHKEPPAHAPNAALLIDFDNVTMAIRSDLQSELKRLLQSEIIRGKVAVQRAYADWRRYQQYVVPLAESSIDLIFAPAYGSSKKNATDIRLAIDALEIVFTRPEIGTFILLSGDSDFSSLVLKLKEYGKYVIGVGIRESSSDLLIQNCDEYYSYNELAGLTKESDIEHPRHDPWELVVEAVKQMTAHNDVMRSDRLKQVMQEIDNGFDEKDAGFSRFSKFVAEAAHRGLIATTRLDNGQYEIGLGPTAQEGAATPGRHPVVTAAPAAPAAAAPAASTARRAGSLVGDAFGLLKQALGRFGGESAVSADQVREAMNEIAPDGTKRVESRTMPRLLRQAQDAELINFSKDPEGGYSVRIRGDEPAPEVAPQPAQAAAAATPEPEEEHEPPMPQSNASPPPYSREGSKSGMPVRSARFRRGSRGPRPGAPDVPKVGVVEVDPTYRPRVDVMPVKQTPMHVPSESSAPGDSVAPRRDRGERGERGGGRGGRGGGSREPRGESEREGGETGDRPSRGRRGGRGRRGRGGGGGGGGGGGERSGGSPPSYESSPARSGNAPVTPSSPPPPPAPKPAERDGESFWTRVKRGLVGGE
jgi:uncharacterized protein (TIGR00288 family)